MLACHYVEKAEIYVIILEKQRQSINISVAWLASHSLSNDLRFSMFHFEQVFICTLILFSLICQIVSLQIPGVPQQSSPWEANNLAFSVFQKTCILFLQPLLLPKQVSHLLLPYCLTLLPFPSGTCYRLIHKIRSQC